MSRAFTNSSYWTHTLKRRAAKVENRTDFDRLRATADLLVEVGDSWGYYRLRDGNRLLQPESWSNRSWLQPCDE